MKIVVLQITSWANISIGVHYYGSLRGEDRWDQHNVTHVLTKTAAKRINEHYCDPDYKYKAGDISEQFFQPDEVHAAAVTQWRKHFPDADVLLVGSCADADPMLCLDGTPELRDRMNKLYNEAEAIGWYDGDNEERMEEIHDEWWHDIMGHERS